MPRIIQTFTDFGNRTWKDRLEGGKADDREPEDFPEDELSIGSKVEREHSSNPDEATELAMDHISEDPEYYDKLITAGLADEEGVVDLFDELKGKNAREKAKKDIMDFMEEDDYNEDEDLNDFDEDDLDEDDLDEEDIDEDDIDEDELGTDKIDVEDDELIIDEDEPKNKKNIMEKSIKNYESFLNEVTDPSEFKDAGAQQPLPPTPPGDAGPERKYSKENKYKFQLPYDKKVVNKLNTYNFTYYVPDDQKDRVVKPSPSTHFIVIDILNLNYAIVDHESSDIKHIDTSRLKHLLEGL